MKQNLDTSLIRAFVAVVASGNMTAAANALGRTQGAVSHQIKRLEAALNCVLFDRSRRGLVLTRQGQRLLDLSEQFLDLNDRICRDLLEQGMRGEVKLGIPYDLVTIYLPSVLNRFTDVNPHVDVSLVCGASSELMDALNRGAVDLAIVEEADTEIRGECLQVERLLWVGAKEGVAYRKRPLPLSIVDETCAFRPAILEALRKADIHWRCVFENGNIEATMATVRADLAVTATLASAIPENLRILPPECDLPELPSFSISLHVRGNDNSPVVAALANDIRGAIISRSP